MDGHKDNQTQEHGKLLDFYLSSAIKRFYLVTINNTPSILARVEIVLINESNIEEMKRIWNDNIDVLSAPGSTELVTTDDLNEMRSDETVEFYGVIVDEDINDEIGGFFVLKTENDVMILDQMAIDDAYKRRGVGDAILRYCKYQAKEKFDNNLELKVFAHNLGGINFFFNNGFKLEDYDSSRHEYTMILKGR